MQQKLSGISGHDAPIQSVEDDLLNALGVARAIHRVLATTPATWSTRVGLYGDWGSGKTSILNLLRTLEEAEGSLVISFSAWSAVGESGVIAQFYENLARRLREERIKLPIKQRAKALAAKVRRFGILARLGQIGAEEFVPAPPVVTKAATEALSKLASAATEWARISRKDLEAIAMLRGGRRVVVFIDDLDRADPRLIPKTLLAMRELLDWPGFSFVLAFDKRAIASALSEYSAAFGDDAQGFVEKVIDVPFEVPDATEKQRRRLAEAAFKTCCNLMPLEAVAAIQPALPTQPRRVKLIARMIGALQPSLARHAQGDVDWTGLCLYLVLTEASQAVAEWVVKAATLDDMDWMVWSGNKEEKKKKQEETKELLRGLLSAPKPPTDTERVVNAALRLLRHWDGTSNDAVLYWVGLVYREPSMTMNEFRKLRQEFAESNDSSVVDAAIRQAASNAGVSEFEAATAYVAEAISSYQKVLEAMAQADTKVEWCERYNDAEKSLLLLEHFWIKTANESLATAAAQGSVTAALLGVVGTWLSWTKNEGEQGLRQRENDLALTAVDKCVDPELLFESTDPFWNSNFSESHESAAISRAWREILRDALAPRVVSRLCKKFLEAEGLFPIAMGEDKLGPWLVESKASPLYTKPELAEQLVDALRRSNGASESVRAVLSKNARLFLQQLLFQTRDGSWGGLDDARAINAGQPAIIPAAWAAVIDIPVPFRMRSSLRKLRSDLLGVGAAADQLLEPAWLAEEIETSAQMTSDTE
ncbi:hypothetical protein J2W35_005858 [Variovorax boronicumulans]|uniref:KAP family P-loop NTPase fold protein n=1 Tax=Variovorax boronicumulans TaxID=436515 RepID=UPI0027884320|nr:P-loop NTPase fold protein [Variovorax boronicumulans]MDQ0085479.1 hypothetical protein [Variovorax boronicumulans]